MLYVKFQILKLAQTARLR